MKFYEKTNYTILLLFVLSLNNSLFGQKDAEYDSIIQYSMSYPSKKLQIKNLLTQADKFLEINANLSLKIAERGISEISKKDQSDTYVEFLHCVSKAQSYIGLSEMAFQTNRKAEELCILNQNYVALGKTHRIRAHIIFESIQSNQIPTSQMSEKWKKKIRQSHTCVERLIKVKKVQGLDFEHLNLRLVIEYLNGNPTKALEILLDYYENKSFTTSQEFEILSTFAGIYSYQGDMKTAETYLFKAYFLIKDQPLNKDHYVIALNLAQFFKSIKKFEKAHEYAKEAMSILQHLKIKSSLSAAGPLMLADINYELNNHELGLAFLKQGNIELTSINESVNKSALKLSEEQIKKELSRQKELGTKRDKIQILNNKVKQKEYLLISIILLALVGIVSLLVFFIFRLKLKRLQKEENMYSAHMELDRKVIQNVHKQITETNNHLNEIEAIVTSFQKENPQAVFTKKIALQLKEIKTKVNLEKNWSTFQEEFRAAYPDFEKRLYTICNNLSLNDVKMSFLLKSGYGNTEIAQMKGISSEGVKTAIKRLKKKLNLEEEANLHDFLFQL